jgi:hypothetical protein
LGQQQPRPTIICHLLLFLVYLYNVRGAVLYCAALYHVHDAVLCRLV